MDANRYSLVADVGGTNTRCALAENGELISDTVTRFRNADHAGLETVLRTYLEQQGSPDCRGAAVAVAGPVRDGRGELTNLDWSIDEITVARAADAEVSAVLNDLQAQGHAMGYIPDDKLSVVCEGPDSAAAAPTRLVIGVGTGFNAAPVYDFEGSRLVPPSEAGHANMPIRTEAELDLCKFVEGAHGFPAVEDVLSGRGLERIYAWLANRDGDPREMRSADIVQAAETGEDERADAAIKTFVRTLGTVAGNLALNHLPFGGVYLVGGMSRATAPHFARHGFTDAFRDKGRFSGFMKNFAVSVVEDDYAALTGLAIYVSTLR